MANRATCAARQDTVPVPTCVRNAVLVTYLARVTASNERWHWRSRVAGRDDGAEVRRQASRRDALTQLLTGVSSRHIGNIAARFHQQVEPFRQWRRVKRQHFDAHRAFANHDKHMMASRIPAVKASRRSPALGGERREGGGNEGGRGEVAQL